MRKTLVTYTGLARYGVTYSRFHLRRLEAEGRFPRRVRLSPQRVAWVEDEVAAWAAERIAERDSEAA